MLGLSHWQMLFAAIVLAASLVVLAYAEMRRLLNAAIDDRYGNWKRFREWTRTKPAGSRFASDLQYAIAFFFCYGVHDLWRLLALLGFDLFVLLALLAPFWRYVYFNEWNPLVATAIAAAAVLLYVSIKLRLGLQLCWTHDWGPPEWRCARCGEYHLHAEELARPASRRAVPKDSVWDRLSWHRLWERRLDELDRLATKD